MSEQTEAKSTLVEVQLAKAELQLADAESKLAEAGRKMSKLAEEKKDAENELMFIILASGFVTSLYCYVRFVHPYVREWYADLVVLYEKVMEIYQWLVWTGAV